MTCDAVARVRTRVSKEVLLDGLSLDQISEVVRARLKVRFPNDDSRIVRNDGGGLVYFYMLRGGLGLTVRRDGVELDAPEGELSEFDLGLLRDQIVADLRRTAGLVYQAKAIAAVRESFQVTNAERLGAGVVQLTVEL